MNNVLYERSVDISDYYKRRLHKRYNSNYKILRDKSDEIKFEELYIISDRIGPETYNGVSFAIAENLKALKRRFVLIYSKSEYRIKNGLSGTSVLPKILNNNWR